MTRRPTRPRSTSGRRSAAKQARLAGSYFEAMISGSCDYYLTRYLRVD